MATLTPKKTTLAGVDSVAVAAAGGGDQFANTGVEVLRVANGGGAPVNVTINSQTPCNQGSDHDLVVAVPNGGERTIGPFDTSRFNDANGNVLVTYSAVTSLTVSVLKPGY